MCNSDFERRLDGCLGFSLELFVIGISYVLSVSLSQCVSWFLLETFNNIIKWGIFRLYSNRKAIGSMYNFSFLVIFYFTIRCKWRFTKATYPFHNISIVWSGLIYPETISRFSMVFINETDYHHPTVAISGI